MSQPTAHERTAKAMAQILTNGALAQRLTLIRDEPRRVTKVEREAILSEAIRRLFWKEDYEKHLEGR